MADAFKTVVPKGDNKCEGFLLQTWESSCLACVKPLAWPLAYKTNETAKQNKQQNKAEPLLLGDTLTHSMALPWEGGNAGVGRPILQLVNRMQHVQACAADAPDKNSKLTTVMPFVCILEGILSTSSKVHCCTCSRKCFYDVHTVVEPVFL